MSLNQEQRDQFNKLIDHREEITNALFHIERILKTYFPEEFDVAYRFWIPQITTALYDDSRWLNRGEKTMQQTIDRLMNKIKDDSTTGVSKYIK